MNQRKEKQLNLFEDHAVQIKQPLGNKELVEYGILNEGSDYRIHVGFKVQHIYVFPTQSGRDALSNNEDLPIKPVSLDGMIRTAEGKPVPIGLIEDIQEIVIPIEIYRKYPIDWNMATTTKGMRAVEIVIEMLKRKLIPLPVNIDISDDKSIQIQGTDIIVSSLLRIQVKCDYRAGNKKLGGTGNVFLQLRECNPYKMI